MKPKTLLIIIVLGLVLGGLALFFQQGDSPETTAPGTRMGQKVIPDFPVNEVASINIESTEGKTTLARKDDLWRVEQRWDYPADFEKVSDMLKNVWELKITQEVPVGPSQFSRLNLIPPGSPEAASAEPEKVGTLLTFADGSGKEVGRMLLGQTHSSGSQPENPMMSMMGDIPNGRYITAGPEPKSALLVSENFVAATTLPSAWLDKEFLKVEKPKSITVTAKDPAASWKVERANESADFQLVNAAEGEELDAGQQSSLKSVLANPSVVDIAPKDDAEATALLAEGTQVEITTFDGFNYKITIGVAPGENQTEAATQWEISADLPATERTALAEEKPEDKEAADKAHAERLSALQEKLAKEEKVEQWVYMLTKWPLDGLLKPRAEILKQPEEEVAPAEGDQNPQMPAMSMPIPMQQQQQQLEAVPTPSDEQPAAESDPAPPAE